MTNMMIPRRRNFFDDFMMSPFETFFDAPTNGKSTSHLMKTDVRETETAYELAIDLPGVKKEDVKLTLENGVLSISTARNLNKEEKEEKTGRVIRRERYSGAMSRSFYVGDNLAAEDISARMENGVLSLTIPKKGPKLPEKKTIAIEG